MVRAHFPQKSGLSIISGTNNPSQGVSGEAVPPPPGGSALVQQNSTIALVQTGTLSALIQTEL